MKNITTIGAALMLTTTAAYAGGLDRSGQGVGIIFEDGGAVELSYSTVIPTVSGALPVAPGVALGSGNVADSYTQLSLGVKQDMNENLSLSVIMDQPFGANVNYGETDPGYPLAGSNADYSSNSLTGILRYKLNDNFSVHAGARSVSVEANATVVSPAGTYDAQYASDSGLGYVVGAAYERKDIALRVALTYSSAIEMSHATTVQVAPGVFAPVPNTEYELPQSVNLDFQTGVAANTLVFGSIRWAEWSGTQINSAGYPANPLVGFDNDSISYNIGVGRKFSDAFSGSISFGYEEASGGIAPNLAPTDGNYSVAIGGAYDLGDGLEISGGVRYVMIGDADTQIGPATASFSDNSAIGVGVKVGYSF